MSPTRQNRRFVATVRSKFYDSTSFALPRLELLEDRLNPAGMANAIGSGFHQPIGPKPAVADVAIVDAELLSRIPESELRGSKVIAIDGNSSPIIQIDRALQGITDISVLRIISHGEPGALWLGGERIDAEMLTEYAAEVRSWGRALTADADLLLYGCSVAATSDEVRFIQNLADLTGADIAASSNTTGKGGDTTLECSIGAIEHGLKAGGKEWSAANLSLPFTNLDSATFYTEQGNTFTLMTDQARTSPFSLVSGALPKGISFDPEHGNIYGIPAKDASGTYRLLFSTTTGMTTIDQPFTLKILYRHENSPGAYGGYNAATPLLPNAIGFATLNANGSIASWYASGSSFTPSGHDFVQVSSNFGAFAALRTDGSIVAWGISEYGGSGYPTGTGYQKIVSLGIAFAAFKANGSVEVWGKTPQIGSDPPDEEGVTDLVSNGSAIAALKKDGSIFAWGDPKFGGSGYSNSHDFTAIFPTEGGFIGLRKDGSIAAWGQDWPDAAPPPTDSGYVKIESNGYAFVGLKANGKIAAWGGRENGGIGAPVQVEIVKVYSISPGFLALDRSGRIHSWGSLGSLPLTAEENKGFVSIQYGEGLFAAIRRDGSLYSWRSGDPSSLSFPTGDGYSKVIYNNHAFLALRSDGTLATWGNQDLLEGVPTDDRRFIDIYSTSSGFTAIDRDGRLAAWGSGNERAPQDAGYRQIFTVGNISAAVKVDGTIASWGNSDSLKSPTEPGFIALASPVEQPANFPVSALSLYTAVQNAEAFYQIPVVNHPAPTFSIVSGSLPTGLNLDVRTGVISGRVIAKVGAYSVKISIENGYGEVAKDVTINVIPSLPNVKGEVTFRVGQLSTSAFSNSSPLLDVVLIPVNGFSFENAGLELEPSGIISGSPREKMGGLYQIKVVYPNLITRTQEAKFNLKIFESPQLTFVQKASFYTNELNTFTLMSVGYPNQEIRLAGGSLPSGIRLDSKTGTLQGTPAAGSKGVYQLTFSLENQFHERVVRTLELTVIEKPPLRTAVPDRSFAALSSDGTLISWPATAGAYPTDDDFIEIASNATAFAALKSDGSIKAWGQPGFGGTGAPTDKDYVKIYSNGQAFAALKKDGHIASWGYGVDKSGGYRFISAPTDGGYVDIVSNPSSFAAIKADGSISTWGDAATGGFGGPYGSGFQKIVAGPDSFVALKKDGTVFSWGDYPYRGPAAPSDDGYIQVFANESGFAALKSDGSIASWGTSRHFDNTKAPQDKGYTSIVFNNFAFAALKSDSSISVWGDPLRGGSLAPTSNGFVKLIANDQSFAALSEDGRLFSWGSLFSFDSDPPAGGGFVQVVSNGVAFAALRSDGSIEAWGNFYQGGNGAPRDVGYRTIVPNSLGFAALKPDGSISSWGDASIQNPPKGTGFVEIVANREAFVALREDGTIQAWGSPESGGKVNSPGRRVVSFATPGVQLPWVAVEESLDLIAPLNQTFSTLVPIRGYPYSTISVSKGALPPGMQFDQQSGLLLGKPTKVGVYSFTLMAQNDLTAVSLDLQVKVGSAFNDPPSGLDATLVSLEDQAVVLKELDFGFTDAIDTPANGFLSVRIVTLPAKGFLYLSGKAIVVNQEVPIAAIRAGKLAYLPPKNAAGEAFAKFTFRNRDNGGRKGLGNDLATFANTITFRITAVNDAPSGKNKTIPINEDSPYSLTIGDFGFFDTSDSPANALSTVLITSLPAKGALTLFGAVVVINQEIPVALLSQGGLVFTPASQSSGIGYGSISFKVRDNGGTASGGVDVDPITRKLTWDVFPVNDAPVGTDRAVSLYEDRVYKFTGADFQLTDPNDGPSNRLSAIQITTLPERGTISLAGKAVKAGQEIFVQDITAGKFAYTPPVNANGNELASFAFKVRDNGGTLRGGVNLAVDANRIAFDVVPVNDAPSAANRRLTVAKTVPLVFTVELFGFVDSKDSPSNGPSRVQFTVLPAPGKGTLSLNGVALKANAFVTVADIVAGKLKYALPLTAKGKGFATISFKVEDDGGIANGGKNLALTANTFTIDVG